MKEWKVHSKMNKVNEVKEISSVGMGKHKYSVGTEWE